MPAGEFKTKCLELMDNVRDRRAEITITKRGVPVCKIVPLDQTPEPVFGSMAGTVLYYNDPTEPTGEKWEADE
ncbi:MAG: type II toxin-antitoxin system Phd/YefM family antitoxin [Gemmatimonadaceae bacterium]|nr:type II toxin-antitoxin system Phd/YefM family antitoxin [Gemmatimonadaceae bacterium]